MLPNPSVTGTTQNHSGEKTKLKQHLWGSFLIVIQW